MLCTGECRGRPFAAQGRASGAARGPLRQITSEVMRIGSGQTSRAQGRQRGVAVAASEPPALGAAGPMNGWTLSRRVLVPQTRPPGLQRRRAERQATIEIEPRRAGLIPGRARGAPGAREAVKALGTAPRRRAGPVKRCQERQRATRVFVQREAQLGHAPSSAVAPSADRARDRRHGLLPPHAPRERDGHCRAIPDRQPRPRAPVLRQGDRCVSCVLQPLLTPTRDICTESNNGLVLARRKRLSRHVAATLLPLHPLSVADASSPLVRGRAAWRAARRTLMHWSQDSRCRRQLQ